MAHMQHAPHTACFPRIRIARRPVCSPALANGMLAQASVASAHPLHECLIWCRQHRTHPTRTHRICCHQLVHVHLAPWRMMFMRRPSWCLCTSYGACVHRMVLVYIVWCMVFVYIVVYGVCVHRMVYGVCVHRMVFVYIVWCMVFVRRPSWCLCARCARSAPRSCVTCAPPVCSC